MNDTKAQNTNQTSLSNFLNGQMQHSALLSSLQVMIKMGKKIKFPG